jgi:hypothetical protein
LSLFFSSLSAAAGSFFFSSAFFSSAFFSSSPSLSSSLASSSSFDLLASAATTSSAENHKNRPQHNAAKSENHVAPSTADPTSTLDLRFSSDYRLTCIDSCFETKFRSTLAQRTAIGSSRRKILGQPIKKLKTRKNCG